MFPVMIQTYFFSFKNPRFFNIHFPEEDFFLIHFNILKY